MEMLLFVGTLIGLLMITLSVCTLRRQAQEERIVAKVLARLDARRRRGGAP